MVYNYGKHIGGDKMYQINNIFSAYKSAIKEIREFNEAMKQLCEESKDHEGIKIVEVEEDNNTIFNVMMDYEGNNIRLEIEHKWLIDKVKNFYRCFPDKLKGLDAKDKIICIVEARIEEAVHNMASIIE